jgi:hypothetical protein
MEILYWSLKSGQTVVPLDEALQIIASEPIFWVGT